MKLVNTNSGFVVVEFVDHEPQFHDPILEMEMKEIGIAIPLVYRSEYDDRERVFFDDPLFEKAFRELFVKFKFDPKAYTWQSFDSNE